MTQEFFFKLMTSKQKDDCPTPKLILRLTRLYTLVEFTLQLAVDFTQVKKTNNQVFKNWVVAGLKHPYTSYISV